MPIDVPRPQAPPAYPLLLDWNKVPTTKEEHARADLFVDRLYCGDRVSQALTAAGLMWRTVSHWQCYDKDGEKSFAARCSDAMKVHTEIMAIRRGEEADRRGLEGWDEPIYQQGREVGKVRRFSDRLLESRMTGGVQKHEHSGPGGGPMPMTVFPPGITTVDDWEKFAEKQLTKPDPAAPAHKKR